MAACCSVAGALRRRAEPRLEAPRSPESPAPKAFQWRERSGFATAARGSIPVPERAPALRPQRPAPCPPVLLAQPQARFSAHPGPVLRARQPGTRPARFRRQSPRPLPLRTASTLQSPPAAGCPGRTARPVAGARWSSTGGSCAHTRRSEHARDKPERATGCQVSRVIVDDHREHVESSHRRSYRDRGHVRPPAERVVPPTGA
ncbi:hypothetical protein D3C85_1134680 [compost metagenome]